MNKPTIYLAGAIRDGVADDIAWREETITALGKIANIINPMGGKSFDEATGLWHVSGVPSGARLIVKHDFWAVDRADIVIFNFTALTQKYPNIGTLVEFGRATATGALIYSIIDDKYEGHDNKGMKYGLHPFLAETSACVFQTVSDCINFCVRHIPVLTGETPRYGKHKHVVRPFIG